MQRFQFSISTILAVTFLVAIVLSLGGGFCSESSLLSIWIASFLLAYWWFPQSGWRQVVRVTVASALIWGVLILCAYVWFVNRKGAPSVLQLASHGALIVLAAAVAAFAAACLVEASRALVRSWLRASWCRRVMLAVPLLTLISLGAAVWTRARQSPWEPACVTSASQAFREQPHWQWARTEVLKAALYEAAIRKAGRRASRAGNEKWELCTEDRNALELLRSSYLPLVVASSDGRFVAAILSGQTNVLVFDLTSGELAARLTAANDERFSDLTFAPDSSVLTALMKSETAGWKVVQWEIACWRAREPIALGDLLNTSGGDGRTHVSLDRCLLVVRCRPVDERTLSVKILTANLLEEPLTLRPFASGDIEMEKTPRPSGLRIAVYPHRWVVSPSAKWIATSGYQTSARGDYLFCAGGGATRLRGKVLGFFSDSDCLAMHEESEGFCWKRERPGRLAPPYWEHLRIGLRGRVLIFDCHRKEVIATSRWLPDLHSARMSLDGSQLVAERGESLLIWELPDAARRIGFGS